jgi:hypothetical protein
MPNMPNISTETLGRVRALALEQVRLMDQLEAALDADDTPRVVEIARKLCALERELRQ